jgi:DNA-directed RNA polymerase subunit alpha
MIDTMTLDVRDIILSNSSFGPKEIQAIARAIAEDYSLFGVLRDAVHELDQQTERSPAMSVKLGVGHFLLGRYHRAIEVLANADRGAVAFFYMGKSHLAMSEFDEAVKCFESAKTAGYDKDLCALGMIEARRHQRQLDVAMRMLDDMFGPVEQTAEYLYQRGATVAAIGGNPTEVVALYERAVESDPYHPGALFGLALENDRRGNDMEAINYYQKAASLFPTNLGTLLNLGVLYEDHNQYDQASRCYNRILEVFPDHARALLYRKDSAASGDEWDYNKAREEERIRQVLKTSIADFELSVRSRNCLQRMGIQSLGDLTRISELDLLSSKNFGETSLVEIRDMMAAKGLRIGQYAFETRPEEEPVDTSTLSADERAMFDRPISDLNLSVRARKCMNRLGLSTLGELLRKSGDDLLECKNFGVTSLNEVREKLTQMGLKLRGE